MIKIGCAATTDVSRCRMSIFIWIIVLGGLFAGCAARQPVSDKKDISPEAEKLLEQLSRHSPPTCFKGYGKYRLELPDGKLSGKMAWAVIPPDLFRAEILDVTGRPFTTLASDGQWLYAHLKSEHRFYKKNSTKATFTHLMGAPVTVKDIIGFLGGRIPLRPYQKAAIRTGKKELVLVLRGRWNHLAEEVYFDKGTLTPVRVVMFSKTGEFLYQVDIGEVFHRKGYSFFQELSFLNSRHHGLRVTLDRVWPNVKMAPSIFKLQDPYSR